MEGRLRFLQMLMALASQTRMLKQAGFRDEFTAKLGKGDGRTITAPDIPTKDSNYMVYYYDGAQGRNGTAILLSPTIPYANSTAYHGTEIRIAKAPAAYGFGDQECVIGLSLTGAFTKGTLNPVGETIGNEGTYPSTEQFRALRVEEDSGLSVSVRGPYWYPKNDRSLEWTLYEDSSIDLTSYVPTGDNEQRIGVVYLDPLTNELGFLPGEVTVGIPPQAYDTITADQVLAIDWSDKIPCGVVYLHADETEIVDADIQRQFEIRSIFYPPRLKLDPSPAGVWTRPQSIEVDNSGRIISIVAGTAEGGGGTAKTVKFKPGASFTIIGSDVPLSFNTSVQNDDSAGSYSAPYFQFTPPQDATYKIRVHLELENGYYNPSSIFIISVFDSPDGDRIPVLRIDADMLIAGSVFDNNIYLNLDMGQTVIFEGDVYGSNPDFNLRFGSANSYIEVTWTAGAPPINDANTITASIDFDYSDTFPLIIRTAADGGEIIVTAQPEITTAFDDGTQFTIGDDGDDDRAVTAAQILTGRADTIFEIAPKKYVYAGGTAIKLYKPAGTPTTGSGTITLTLKGQ